MSFKGESSLAGVRLQYESQLAEMTKELMTAQKAAPMLVAANQRIAELEASAKTTHSRLSTIIDADALQQEQVRLLRQALDAERRKVGELEERMQADQAQSEKKLQAERDRNAALEAEIQRVRDDLEDYQAGVIAEQTRQHEAQLAKALEDADAALMAKAKVAGDRMAKQGMVWAFSMLKELWNEIVMERQIKKLGGKAVRRMMNADLSWAWSNWKDTVFEELWTQQNKRKLEWCRSKIDARHLTHALEQWCVASREMRIENNAARPLRRLEMKHACQGWRQLCLALRTARRTMEAMARRRRHKWMSGGWVLWVVRARCLRMVAMFTADLHSAVIELSAPKLGASIVELRGLEEQRREERLQRAQKHAQQVNDLKRANARILHEFAEAEDDFRRHEKHWQEYELHWQDAERRWRHAGVVDRVLEAVFGTAEQVEHAWPEAAGSTQLEKQRSRKRSSSAGKSRGGGGGSGLQVVARPRGKVPTRPAPRAPLRLPSPYKDEWPASPAKADAAAVSPATAEGPTGHTSSISGFYYEEEAPPPPPPPVATAAAASAAAGERNNRLRARRQDKPGPRSQPFEVSDDAEIPPGRYYYQAASL